MTSSQPGGNWSWKKTWLVAGVGVLVIAGMRVTLLLVSTALVEAGSVEPFEETRTITMGPQHTRATGYEITLPVASFSYDVRSTDGDFSLFVVPYAETEAFLAGGPFAALGGHVHRGTDVARGEVILPEGKYALAIACEGATGCTIGSTVRMAGSSGRPADDLVNQRYTGPSVLFDRTFSLDAGETLGSTSLVVADASDLEVRLTSDAPTLLCIVAEPEWEAFLDGPDRKAVVCEEDARDFVNAVAVDAGSYRVFVECSRVSPCHGWVSLAANPLPGGEGRTGDRGAA